MNPVILDDSGTNPVRHMFLVGGFAESPTVQEVVRNEFENINVIIPQVSTQWKSHFST